MENPNFSPSSGSHLGPGTHTLPATIATCILRADEEKGTPHGRPTECLDNSRQQNLACMGDELETLMQIDTEVNNFGGLKRRSETFLRFEIPPIAGGLEVVGASLHVRHAIHKAWYRPQTGEVWRSSPFDTRSLDADAPVLEDLLAAEFFDMGEDLFDRFPDRWVVWELPLDPNVLAPGQPLYLSLQPTHTLGAYYHGLGDDLEGDDPPELHLTIE